MYSIFLLFSASLYTFFDFDQHELLDLDPHELALMVSVCFWQTLWAIYLYSLAELEPICFSTIS